MVIIIALLSIYSYYQLIIKRMFIKENRIKQKRREKVKSKISLVVNSLATMVVLLL